MGTGPFKFVEYVPNTRIVLEQNENYWEEGLPYLDGIEMTIASDDTARTAAVVRAQSISSSTRRCAMSTRSKQTPSLTLAGDANTNIRFIGFNMAKRAVRQARSAPGDRRGRRSRADDRTDRLRPWHAD